MQQRFHPDEIKATKISLGRLGRQRPQYHLPTLRDRPHTIYQSYGSGVEDAEGKFFTDSIDLTVASV